MCSTLQQWWHKALATPTPMITDTPTPEVWAYAVLHCVKRFRSPALPISVSPVALFVVCIGFVLPVCMCVCVSVCLCTLLTLLRQPDKCCIQNAAQQLRAAHGKKLPLQLLLARRIQILHCYNEACLGI